MKLSLFRRIIQAVFFIAFVILFVYTTYPFAKQLPVDLFLRLDPLVSLVSMIAARAIISTMFLAGILLVSTFIFGRFFCGYMCPLGTLIDMSDFVFFGRKHKRESSEPKPNRRIKYFILIGVFASALVGANVLAFFSPMSIMPHLFTVVIYPPIIWFVNSTVDLLRPVLVSLGLDNFTQISFQASFFATGIAAFFLLALIVGANFWRKRFWCRFVCPTGALLSIFSRYGIIKRKVNPSLCSDCKLCASKCDMRAIDHDHHHTILSECTLCGACVDACKKNAISIGFGSIGFSTDNHVLNVHRRSFVQSAAAGLLLATTVKTGLSEPKNIEGRFIRPPGSLPEPEFLARCIRCGECMKVCKTNGLQPAFLEAGFNGLWSPHLVPRHGACEEKCNMCGMVCPTQAIRALPLPEKQFVKIGTAVIDRSRCVAWEQNKLCLMCDEICPYDAIETKVVDNFNDMFKRPFVNAEKCTGCGYCEKVCPVYGRAAIEIYSIGEERKKTGSYITPRKKEMRELKDTGESQYSAEQMGSGGETKGMEVPVNNNNQDAKKVLQNVKKEEKKEEKMPKGFTE